MNERDTQRLDDLERQVEANRVKAGQASDSPHHQTAEAEANAAVLRGQVRHQSRMLKSFHDEVTRQMLTLKWLLLLGAVIVAAIIVGMSLLGH